MDLAAAPTRAVLRAARERFAQGQVALIDPSRLYHIAPETAAETAAAAAAEAAAAAAAVGT